MSVSSWSHFLRYFFFVLVLGLVWSNGTVVATGSFFFVLLFLSWIDQYKFLRKCLQGIPALQLAPQALIDNTNNLIFSWKDIQSFKDPSVNTSKGSGKPYIAIDLFKEADHISLIPGLKNRIMARLKEEKTN